MLAVLRIEAGKLVRGTLLLGGMFALFSVFFLGVFPGIQEEAEALQEAFPEYMIGLLGFEEMHTIEGYTAGYIFPLMLILFVGVYVAYVAATMINADVRARRIDLLLSNPITRESIVFQKFAALAVPIVGLNVVVFVILLLGAHILGEPLDPFVLGIAHLLAIPYLLACGAIGILLSVLIGREASAQGAAIGVVFVLWLLEGIAEMDERYDPIGLIVPSGYYDPNAVLVHGEYAWLDALILLFGTAVILGLAMVIFVRRDI